ncbi:unnamed protein product [Urochloa decumbens]|uniref:Uncharacterized protein n=1 Tax=Urochloa decumbens TaxID=240449 RepID=A0ABC9B1R9_9POAL
MSTNTASTIVGGGGDGSMSTVSAETVTGWHLLKVEGYSNLKGLGVGKRIKSGAFNVGGHSWCVTFFPDGFSKEKADWICVHLYLNNPAANCNSVKARKKFSLLDQAGEPVPSYTFGGDVIWTFSCNSAWGFEKFIRRADLESSSYLIDDSFQIRCDVTVFQEIRVESTTIESLTVPPPDLHLHLGDLLASDIGRDVTFEVSGETFPAHKYVLAARSSVFKAELFGPMKEKGMDCVRIDEMEPRVFKAMLQFIYTDRLSEINTGKERIVMHQHLLVAADRYNMERLKLICEDVLCKHIDTDIAATTLVLAEQHGCRGLKEACFKFLRRSGNAISGRSWQLMASNI